MAVKITLPPETGNPKPEAPNMCLGCPGHCCKLTVDLTSYDIARIMALEKRVPDDFAMVVDASPDDYYGIKVEGGTRKIVLQHKGEYCVFFDRTARRGCTIEDSKPSICIYYPFHIRRGHPVIQEKALCPPANRARIDHAKMSQKALDDCYWEMERYAEIVSDWNALTDGKRTMDEFMEFASSEMKLEMNPFTSIYRKLKRMLIRPIA
jgi:Fe-S-cluster containining protein